MSSIAELPALITDLLQLITEQGAVLHILQQRLERTEQFVYGGATESKSLEPKPEPQPPPTYLTPKQAAAYLALPGGNNYLLQQSRDYGVPKCFRPSSKVVLFEKHDLDVWRASW